MAYEDYWKDDPMPDFSDDEMYYDENVGFYDEFGEKIDDPELIDDSAAEPAAEDTTSEEATPASNAQKLDRDFRETLESPHTSDQLEDSNLEDEAKRDYNETP